MAVLHFVGYISAWIAGSSVIYAGFKVCNGFSDESFEYHLVRAVVQQLVFAGILSIPIGFVLVVLA